MSTMSVLVLCVGGGIGCTLAHHTAWQACSLPTCMQHPLLISFAFFNPCHLCRSNLSSGDWRFLPTCIAALVVLAYLSTSDDTFASCCHTLACEPHQPTCFIPCHLCRSNLNSGDWRCLPICIAALALFGCQHCCHVGIMACHNHCL